MRKHRVGSEPNSLEILVHDIDIKSYGDIRNGVLYSDILLKFGMYDLDDVLIQMLEDYGEEKLIARIKGLE